MFGTLVESQGARARRPGGAAVSLLVHSAIITGAVSATATRAVHATDARADSAEIVYYQPIASPRPVPPPSRASAAAPSGARSGDAPSAPVIDLHTIPATLPPIDAPLGEALRRVDAPVEPAITGTPGSLPAGDRPWDAAEVEREARLLNRVTPVYPRALAASGLEGRVVVRFVVDTLGRAEPASIDVVESTHELFERAAREAIGRMRFAPAVAGGAKVRMAAELPFVFALRR